MWIPTSGIGWAQAPGPDAVFAPAQEPYGVNHAVWGTRYLRWFQGIPVADNPVLHPDSPKNCQNRGRVVFLSPVGTGHGCDVDAGTAVLFSPTGNSCYTDGPRSDTFAELERCVTLRFEAARGDGQIIVRIDGDRVRKARPWVVMTHRMTFDYPEHNMYGIRPGPRKNVTKLMLMVVKPPAPATTFS
jgi:hypothetical protein